MGMLARREHARETNARYQLRAAVDVVPFPPYTVKNAAGVERTITPPSFIVVGECGHRLDVISPGLVNEWQKRIAEGRRHRKRCEGCPR